MDIGLLLAGLAFGLAAIEQVRAEGKSLLAWAVMALALVPLIAYFPLN